MRFFRYTVCPWTIGSVSKWSAEWFIDTISGKNESVFLRPIDGSFYLRWKYNIEMSGSLEKNAPWKRIDRATGLREQTVTESGSAIVWFNWFKMRLNDFPHTLQGRMAARRTSLNGSICFLFIFYFFQRRTVVSRRTLLTILTAAVAIESTASRGRMCSCEADSS